MKRKSPQLFSTLLPLFGGRWRRPPQLVVAPRASSKFHPGIRKSAESAMESPPPSLLTDGGCTYCFLPLLLLLHILPAMQRRNTQSIPLPSIARIQQPPSDFFHPPLPPKLLRTKCAALASRQPHINLMGAAAGRGVARLLKWTEREEDYSRQRGCCGSGW